MPSLSQTRKIAGARLAAQGRKSAVPGVKAEKLPMSRAPQEWQVYGRAWEDPIEVGRALDAVDRGNLLYGEQLLLGMEKHPKIAHGLFVRSMSHVATEMVLSKPAGLPDDAYNELVASWCDIYSEATMATSSRYRVMLGVAPCPVTWGLGRSGRYWMPQIHARSAGRLKYDTNEQRYEFSSRDAGPIPVTDDGLSWLLFKALSGNYPHLQGSYRPLTAFWWLQSAVWRYWFNQAKVHGSPQRKLKMPAQQREQPDVEDLINLAVQMVGGTVIPLPQYEGGDISFDFDLVEAKARNWESFKDFIELTDNYITLVLLGATDNTQGAAAGSRARAEVHERVSLRYLSSDCRVTAATLRQLLRVWARVNGFPVEWAPQPIFLWEPPEDDKALAEVGDKKASAFRATCEGLAQLAPKGSEGQPGSIWDVPGIDVPHIFRQMGITLTPEPEQEYRQVGVPGEYE